MTWDGECANKQLYQLSKSLKVLILKEWMISPDLFLPQGQSSVEHWCHLRTLRIHALGFAPNGSWYFYNHRSPALDGQTSHLISNLPAGDPWVKAGLWPRALWRGDIRPQTMNPLIEAMSNALLRMNNLEECRLRFGDENLPRGFLFTCMSTQAREQYVLPSPTADKAGVVEYFGHWNIPTSITDCWRELGDFSYKHWADLPTDSDSDDDDNSSMSNKELDE